MRDWPVSHTRVDADKKVLEPGGVYHGGLLLATSGGASTVAVYDGLDADGELIDYFSVLTSAPERHFMERGLRIIRGLFIDLGSNVSAFDVFYDPVPCTPEGQA